MSRKPEFRELTIHRPYRVRRASREGVVGLDTESLTSGYAFLITDSIGNHKWIRSAEDVLTFLTNPLYRRSFNTFWNMDFDATVILKWLGKDVVAVLAALGSVHYGKWFIQYVPRRYLMIRDSKEFFTFFDASQYYVPRSLDGASKAYLGDAKLRELTSKEFSESAYDDPRVLRYCFKDSKLCDRLTWLLLEDFSEMGFDPYTLSSPAAIIEEALVARGNSVLPDMTEQPRSALEYAFNAYHGGWVECFRRGCFSRLWDYDISSAYPYQVSKLVDMNGGEWKYSPQLQEATYGFVYCLVTIDPGVKVSPIMYAGDVNYTPRGQWRTFLTLPEIAFIREHKLGSVEPKGGWYFYAHPEAGCPYRFAMRDLFRQKSQVRNKWLPKSLGVALYGKFGQKDEKGDTGNLFNPVYAAYVTARTRLQLAHYALINPDALVLTTTDGLVLSQPLSSEHVSRDFGGLRLVHCDRGVVVGSNVYTLANQPFLGTWRPGRFDWFKLLRKSPEATFYPLKHFRYTTLREGDFEAVGQFKDFDYDFNINFDRKRVFKKITRGGDLLENQYNSVAWDVSIPQRRREILWELK